MNERVICGIYVRVSTEEQVKEGFSINAQKEKLKQYALLKDWDIHDIYVDDGRSGKNLEDRPEIQRLSNDVEEERINSVLVYKIDRLTRSMKNLLELVELFQRKNCSFNSFTEAIDTSSATGRMFLKIVGIFAEFERENLAERVKFGCEQRAREGKYASTIVFGYDYIKGQGLVVNEYEKQVVNNIFEWYLNSMSFREIAEKLKANNIPTKRGGTWKAPTIYHMLTNSLYKGKVRYGVDPCEKTQHKFEVDAKNIESIISEEIFNNVQLIIKKRRKYSTKFYASENAYFNGSIFCGLCGRKMTPYQHRDKETIGKYLYVGYGCQQESCTTRSISQKKIERAFLKYIKGFTFGLQNEGLIRKSSTVKEEKQLADLIKELARAENKKSSVRSLFLQDKIELEEYKEMLDELIAKTAPIQEQVKNLSELFEEDQEEVVDPNWIHKMVNHLQLNWEEFSNQDKVSFLHKFIKEIKVTKENGVTVITEINFYDLEYKD